MITKLLRSAEMIMMGLVRKYVLQSKRAGNGPVNVKSLQAIVTTAFASSDNTIHMDHC